MQINALTQRAMQVRRLYAELEQKDHGRAWTNEEIARWTSLNSISCRICERQ